MCMAPREVAPASDVGRRVILYLLVISMNWVLVLFQLLIPQVRLAHKYPILPWEMIHLPLGDNALCAPPYTVYTAVCNKSLTATYQYKISNPNNTVLVNNN
jgi:hypothetical protein